MRAAVILRRVLFKRAWASVLILALAAATGAEARSHRAHASSGVGPFQSVVGVVDRSSEHPIKGASGDHLQFYLTLKDGTRYQVDVNTQSRDGSEVQVYSSSAAALPAPAPGVSAAKLSYAAAGLKNAQFKAESESDIDAQLEAALNRSQSVAAFGATFDDGGGNGKGVHDTHYTGRSNQDWAIAIYDGGGKAIWFFFKFDNQSIRGS